ncbi:allantoate amidohydrolase [Telmatospirillum sp.]|uniref:allantoate amidohydrolase n=1 Tax=Telmatospirillum sp. TaxID=2079197 RepID=UPI002851FDD5|nr:allantoate amidohydrolase [Telmatospirillum sp.]MDR3437317.1 allantoate amidohydrolase [Telmatospirillum sp.]
MTDFSRTVMERCDALAFHTETPGMITRTYLTPQHAEANRMVAGWMREAGMTVTIDAAGSVVGRYDGADGGAATVIIGSHLDSVRNAGRYDGILGVLIGIAVVDRLNRTERRLPFAVEVVGFGEEEGVRFGTSLIGSRALAGSFDPEWLTIRDEAGISLADAMRTFGLDPEHVGQAARKGSDVIAYLEAHIEQGPVLESLGLPVGIVSAICGATRRRFRVSGTAGHAGTVPMGQRRDALAGAAEMVLAVERIATEQGVVGTVGRLSVLPDAVNVIPGDVTFTLDVRAEQDSARQQALVAIERAVTHIAEQRHLSWTVETFHESPSVHCAAPLRSVMADAITDAGLAVHTLPSGAGHDAMAIAELAPMAMLFVRCAGGISHNPAESVLAEDVAIASRVMADVLERLATNPKIRR